MTAFHDLAARALHLLPPEDAHSAALLALRLGLAPRDGVSDPALKTRLFHRDLPNPVGLAAGFDKNAEVFAPLLAAGFGFVECGTVTPRPQAGNPRPRLFRLNADQAVINRMGFNNLGLEPFARALEQRTPSSGMLGANIGANKDSEDRIADYVAGIERLKGACDYFTVNVSSPNTPGLRNLQNRASLDVLLERVVAARGSALTPIALKIAPDLTPEEIEEAVDACLAAGIEGLIVSNTTLSRPPSLVSGFRGEAGGLSGAPLFDLSTAALKIAARQAKGKPLTLIGVGGIDSAEAAYAKIRAGASVVQLYSALVYSGLGLVGRINTGLAALLKRDGFETVSEAVGADL